METMEAVPSEIVVQEEPDLALLISMATCINHGFGLLSAPEQNSMLKDMKKVWLETQGLGCYTPERRNYYLGMLNLKSKIHRTPPE